MVTIKIKALSVNRSYAGRRFSTPELKAYKLELAYRLPRNIKIPKTGKLSVFYEFGVSSKLADIDNGIKAFQDALCEKYGFNDRDIYELRAEKKIVKKSEEYIAFEIKGCA